MGGRLEASYIALRLFAPVVVGRGYGLELDSHDLGRGCESLGRGGILWPTGLKDVEVRLDVASLVGWGVGAG